MAQVQKSWVGRPGVVVITGETGRGRRGGRYSWRFEELHRRPFGPFRSAFDALVDASHAAGLSAAAAGWLPAARVQERQRVMLARWRARRWL